MEPVLLVEDDDAHAEITTELLHVKRGQYRVDRAQTLSEAIQQFPLANYRAVLLDLGLPDSRGFETVQQFSKAHPNAVIIVLTSFQDQEVAKSALRIGAQDFLDKDGLRSEALLRSIYYANERAGLVHTLEKRNDELSQEISKRKEADARFRKLIEVCPIGTLAVDEQCLIVLVNQAIEKLFGYGPQELIGQPLNVLIPSEYQSVHAAYVAKFSLNPETRQMGRGRLVHGVTKTGAVIPLEITLGGLETSGAQWNLAMISDRTEVMKQKDELEIRAERLERANQDLEVFNYAASHDLMAPLRSIVGFLEIIKEDAVGNLSEESMGHLNNVTDASHRMSVLIKNLLDFSRASTTELSFGLIDTEELVWSISQDLSSSIPGAKVIHAGLPNIVASPLIRQVFQNLIANGLKFVSAGTTPQVEVTSSEDKEKVFFAIKDNGIGIPKKSAEEVFEAFRRLNSGNEYEGTGIGLAIAKKIVDRHGGRIWVEANPEGGSTFQFSIPRCEDV